MGNGTVVALSGGVGGAKLALGLSRVLGPGRLTVIANTGDDFRHLGLHISPDIDTLLYTLSGLADPVRGWGRRDETWNFMRALGEMGGETWFQLGDLDLALHVERTRRLALGETLSAITHSIATRLKIPARIVPMTDDMVQTRVFTVEGELDFQDYFVRRRCEPRVLGIRYELAELARPPDVVIEALANPALRAVVICPSNPMLSIEPMLAIHGLRQAILDCAAPVIAVSPLIAGQAVKGPTAKILREMGIEPGDGDIGIRYEGLANALLVDESSAPESMPEDLEVIRSKTLMTTLEDRERLARHVLEVADRLA